MPSPRVETVIPSPKPPIDQFRQFMRPLRTVLNMMPIRPVATRHGVPGPRFAPHHLTLRRLNRREIYPQFLDRVLQAIQPRQQHRPSDPPAENLDKPSTHAQYDIFNGKEVCPSSVLRVARRLPIARLQKAECLSMPRTPMLHIPPRRAVIPVGHANLHVAVLPKDPMRLPKEGFEIVQVFERMARIDDRGAIVRERPAFRTVKEHIRRTAGVQVTVDKPVHALRAAADVQM